MDGTLEQRAAHERKYREVLGQYPTGVSAVTSQLDDGTLAGMAVGSFTSVSLDPPLVAFFPARTSSSWPLIERSGRFCVNVLACDQEVVCRQMARPAGDKFSGVRWRPSALGSPVLDGVVAWIDCTIEQVTDAGDHFVVLGAVHALEVENQTLPLVFFRGGYGRFTPGLLVYDEYGTKDQVSLLTAARLEMLQVSAELGVESAITGVDDEGYVLVASSWSPLSSRATIRVGDRIPAAPPLVVPFVAHGGETVRERWIAAGLALDSGASRAELEEVLTDAAERCWSAGVQVKPRRTCTRRFVDVNARLRAGEASGEEFNLTVPVRDTSGEVALATSIYGLDPTLAGATLRACTDRLLAAAQRIEKAVS